MNDKHQGILKRTMALIIAMLIMLAFIPSSIAVAGPDWADLMITISWVTPDGEQLCPLRSMIQETAASGYTFRKMLRLTD